MQIMAFLLLVPGVREVVNKTIEVVENAVVKRCTFENDTDYTVMIVDHDGTRSLDPDEQQGNYLIGGFSVDLVLKLPDAEEVKITFPSSNFENRTHKMSKIFADAIREYESSRAMQSVQILRALSKWHLTFSHPGGYEETASIKMVTKNSWKDMQEKGYEAEAKVGGMIKAIEMSASFKAHTKLTRVDEFESEITKTSERKFKDPCYLWQEIVVVKTDQDSPFDELSIPTANTAMTTTNQEPGKEKFLYVK